MKIITSPDNDIVKSAAKLHDKKFRLLAGQFLLEGKRLVLDALFGSSMSDIVHQIFVLDEKKDEYLPLLLSREDKVALLSGQAFSKISQTENSQGIAAVLAIPKPAKVSGDFVLYLDCVRDPGNIGTILRTVAAAGIRDVIFHDCADPYSPKCVRSAMGGILKTNIIIDKDDGAARIEDLKKDGYEIVCADLDGESIADFEKKGKLCLIIGSEADGPSADSVKLSDRVVTIPMQGTESLNAAVAAAIIIYMIKLAK